MPRVEPGEVLIESPGLAINEAGQPYSQRFNDIYASASGALEQAQAVFLTGVDLPRRWRAQAKHSVLELGFGLGTNFIATYRAWLDDPARSDVLDYVGIEAFPLQAAEWASVPMPLDQSNAALFLALIEQWPNPVEPGFHLLEFEHGRVRLVLVFWDVLKALVELECRVDSVYLDGFAPSKNPQMWNKAVLTGVRRLLVSDGRVASYSVAGSLRNTLDELGFSVRRQVGFGKKKHRLESSLPIARPRIQVSPVRRVAIIGAGIAGVALAEELSRQAFEVTLFERHFSVGFETSAVPAALMHPPSAAHDSLEFGIQSHAYRLVQRRMRCAEALQLASGFHGISISEKRRNGKRHEHLAGGWLEPSVWIQTLWQMLGTRENFVAKLGSEVLSLKYAESTVVITTAQSQDVFDLVVLCNALNAKALLPELNLRPVGGQVEILECARLPPLKNAYCGQANIIPINSQRWCIGNSYERGVVTSTGRPEIREVLMRNAAEMIDFAELSKLAPHCQSWAGTRVESNARLPLIGEYQPKIWLNCAHASKGFMTAFLAAEVISSQLRERALAIPERIRLAVDCTERAT